MQDGTVQTTVLSKSVMDNNHCKNKQNDFSLPIFHDEAFTKAVVLKRSTIVQLARVRVNPSDPC